jgi:thymidylate synthase (FAD)
MITLLTNITEKEILKHLEYCGRNAYSSFDKITDDSYYRFISSIIKNKHDSVLEHASISVEIICDRAIANELVRHRLASYTQQSTRYVNYTKKDIEFLCPSFNNDSSKQIWLEAVNTSKNLYKKLIENGEPPEFARSVLLNSVATNIIITSNIREWRHILNTRLNKQSHPDMIKLMREILYLFQDKFPNLFNDIVR